MEGDGGPRLLSFSGLRFLFEGADVVRSRLWRCGGGFTGGLCEGTEIPSWNMFMCRLYAELDGAILEREIRL